MLQLFYKYVNFIAHFWKKSVFRRNKMNLIKIKVFLMLFTLSFIASFIFFLIKIDGSLKEAFIFGFIYGLFGFMFAGIFGIYGKLVDIFSEKYYKEQDEINFQTNLRREVERKRALSQVDNENLHYQNQLRIEYIAKVAQIQLQSNQYLANMYQQAIISNSTNNELTAQAQLLQIEHELKKQGLI